jgi:hypothetical protein
MWLAELSSTLGPPREDVLSARFGSAVVLGEAVMARKKSLRSELRRELDRRGLVLGIGSASEGMAILEIPDDGLEFHLRTRREGQP